MSVQRDKIDFLVKILASGFGLGYAPFASGTFGTAGGIGVALLLALLSPAYCLASIAILFFVASALSSRAEVIFNKKDSGVIVIDEIVGFAVTMALITPSFKSIGIGFILFRFFDIVKIWPASFFNNKTGGFSVVLDDVVAGIYSNILLRILLAYL